MPVGIGVREGSPGPGRANVGRETPSRCIMHHKAARAPRWWSRARPFCRIRSRITDLLFELERSGCRSGVKPESSELARATCNRASVLDHTGRFWLRYG